MASYSPSPNANKKAWSGRRLKKDQTGKFTIDAISGGESMSYRHGDTPAGRRRARSVLDNPGGLDRPRSSSAAGKQRQLEKPKRLPGGGFARVVDAHAEKWKTRFSYTKSGAFRGYLPGSQFSKSTGNNWDAPKTLQEQEESTHDREIRELMETALTKKSRESIDPLLAEKSFYIRPSGFETRGISPVERNVHWYCHKAWSLARQGHRSEAIKMYEGALNAHPRHIRSLFNAGVLHEECGEYKEAEECFTVIVEGGRAGRIVEGYSFFNRGINAQHRTDFEAALADYTEAISRVPNVADFYNNRAMCARALGMFALAASDIEACRNWTATTDTVEDAIQELYVKATGEVAPHKGKHWMSRNVKRKCQAWATRARSSISAKIEKILAKEIHERDDTDAEALFRAFGYYPALRMAGNEERVRALCRRAVLGRFEKGESIARRRKLVKDMYIVLTGTAMIVGGKAIGEIGSGNNNARPGDALCQVVVEHRNAHADATIIAESNMSVAVISRADFDAVQAGCRSDIGRYSQFLVELPMFQHFSEEQLHELALMCVHQVFPFEQLIIDQDEEAQGLYMVLSGTVRVEKDFEVQDTSYNSFSKEWQRNGVQDAGTLGLGILYPGSFFGEASIIDTASVGRSPIRVVSMSNPVECLLLPRNCRGKVNEEKVVKFLKLLKPSNPNDRQIQDHRAFGKYWQKFKRDTVHQCVDLVE